MTSIEQQIWISAYATAIVQLVSSGEYEFRQPSFKHHQHGEACAWRAIEAWRAGGLVSLASDATEGKLK